MLYTYLVILLNWPLLSSSQLGWHANKHCSFKKLTPSDFDNFDYIFAMDMYNLTDLQNEQRRRRPQSKAKVMLFGDYSGTGKPEPISDPYYGGKRGFEDAYEKATRFSKNFLKDVFPEASKA